MQGAGLRREQADRRLFDGDGLVGLIFPNSEPFDSAQKSSCQILVEGW